MTDPLIALPPDQRARWHALVERAARCRTSTFIEHAADGSLMFMARHAGKLSGFADLDDLSSWLSLIEERDARARQG